MNLAVVNQNRTAQPTSTVNLSATAKLRQQLAEFLSEDVENESDCSDDGIETILHEKIEGIQNGKFPLNLFVSFK